MIGDLTLTGLTEATRVLNWGCIILFLLLGVPSKLLASSKFRILFLLKEMCLRGILVLYGALPAKLSPILVQVVLGLAFEVSVGSGQALGPVGRESPKI